MKMKERTEAVYSISPELRKFLDAHMEKGKSVDKFMGSLNDRTKAYAADVLKLNAKIGKLKTQDDVQVLTEESNALKKKYFEDLTSLVTANVKTNYKEAAATIGVVALIGTGIGFGASAAAAALAGETLFQGLTIGITGGVGGIAGIIGTIEAGGATGMSPKEKEALEYLAKEGVVPGGAVEYAKGKMDKNTKALNDSARSLATGFVIGSVMSHGMRSSSMRR